MAENEGRIGRGSEQTFTEGLCLARDSEVGRVFDEIASKLREIKGEPLTMGDLDGVYIHSVGEVRGDGVARSEEERINRTAPIVEQAFLKTKVGP